MRTLGAMDEYAVPFEVVPDITEYFGRIEFAVGYEADRTLSVTMFGARDLALKFRGVIAVRHEDECPGFDPFPKSLPELADTRWAFPVLKVEGSRWCAQWEGIHSGKAHFALLSESDLLQVIASPVVEAHWN
jgi:hypothetical protein